ncbi:hypothetical protein [Bdellovibrio bacteriovorus]|uniref:hypothetical protein n=1 Tax=Bdellovibrio bacteriovorus TaxID=959 RepID=UPI0012DA6C34|nr:hypothetical protein [Bdellovibrio bacteriovorus]
MLRKSLLNKSLLSIVFLVFAEAALAVAPKYPAIREVYGQVWLTGKDGKRALVKGRQVLREKALLETSLTGRVKVELDEKRNFILLGSGEVLMPVISWESGEAPVVILKSGDLHWNQKEKGAYNIALRSDLFEFLAIPGDYVLSIYPQKAFTGVKVFEGTMEFSALNGEESVTVKKGQQAGFQGVIENGEISYDVLLKGKKIPKGRLTAVTPIDAGELNKAAADEKKRLDGIAKLKAQEQARLAKLKREGVICSQPAGKFNECVWTCVNNPKKEKKNCLVQNEGTACVRRRCNANGDWSEETTLDAEKASIVCKAQPVVAICDY